MASPVEVKGVKKLLDKINEEILQAADKLTKKVKDVGGWAEISGSLIMDGDFEFDKDGAIKFKGHVVADLPLPSAIPLDLGIEIGPEAGKKWSSEGDGKLKIAFAIRYQTGVKPDGSD